MIHNLKQSISLRLIYTKKQYWSVLIIAIVFVLFITCGLLQSYMNTTVEEEQIIIYDKLAHTIFTINGEEKHVPMNCEKCIIYNQIHLNKGTK